jgi:hypothetical protein
MAKLRDSFSTNDVKSMFFQFSVHPSLRKFFGFSITQGKRRSNVEHFRLCALPIGICFAPTFARRVSNYICNLDVLRIHFDLNLHNATPTLKMKEKLRQATLKLQHKQTNSVKNALFVRWFGSMHLFV